MKYLTDVKGTDYYIDGAGWLSKSDGTPPDFATDPGAKQANYFIQPAVTKYRPLQLQSGLSEQTEMNEEYVAVTFERQVDLENLSKVQDLMRWCCRQIGGAA